MIKVSTARQGIDVTYMLDNEIADDVNSFYVEAGTGLANVVSTLASKPASEEMITAECINRISLPVEEGLVGGHYVNEAKLAEEINNATHEIFDFAINSAKPLIIDVFKNITEEIREKETQKIKTGFNIIKDDLHPLLTNDRFIDLLENDAAVGVTRYKVYNNFKMHDFTLDDLLQEVKTGFDDIDEGIGELFEYDDVMYSTLLMSAGKGDGSVVSNLRIYFTAKFIREKLFEIVYASDNSSKEDLEENMTHAMSYAANNLIGYLNKQETISNSKDLVKTTSGYSGDLDIIVNADVYARWLEEGGSSSTLMGYFVENPKLSSTDYDLLLQKAEYYSDVYTRHCVGIRAKDREDTARAANARLRLLLKSAITANWEEFESTRISVNLGDCSFLDKLKDEDFSGISENRLYMIIRDVLCQTLWIKTDLHKVFRLIDSYYELLDKDDKVEHAIEMAKVCYMADLVSSMIGVSK